MIKYKLTWGVGGGVSTGNFKEARDQEFEKLDENFDSHPCSDVARKRLIPPGDVAGN